jgi:hypothetical protein
MAPMLNSEGKSEWEHKLIEDRLTLAKQVLMLEARSWIQTKIFGSVTFLCCFFLENLIEFMLLVLTLANTA